MRGALLLLCVLAGVARAERPAQPRADDLVAAFRSGDRARFAELAAGVTDPWAFVNVLLSRGAADAADALAELVPGERPGRLADYIAACRAAPLEGEGMLRVKEAMEAMAAGLPDRVLEITAAPPHEPLRVADVILSHYRREALRALGRTDQASEEAERGAVLAERLGWARAQWECLHVAANLTEDATRKVALFERKLALAEEVGDPEDIGGAWASLGAALRESDGARAIHCLERSLEFPRRDPRERAPVLSLLGLAYTMVEDPRHALACYEEAHAIFDAAGDRVEAANSLWLAVSAMMRLEQRSQARRVCEHARANCAELLDRGEMAQILLHLGQCLEDAGNTAAAIDCLEQAIGPLEEIPDHRLAALALLQLAHILEILGESDRAIGLMERAAAHLRAAGSEAGAEFVRISIASTRKDAEGMLAALETTLARSAGTGEPMPPGLRECVSGWAMMGREDLARARPHFEKLRESAEARGAVTELVSALGMLAKIDADCGDLARAQEGFTRCLALSRELGLLALEADTMGDLARIARLRGDPRRALALARDALKAVPRITGGLGAHLGSAARSHWAGVFETGALAARDAGDPDEAAFFLESGRAGALLEAFKTSSALAEGALPEELRAAEVDAGALAARCATEFRSALAKGTEKEATEGRRAYEAAMRAHEEVIERIQRTNARVADITHPKADTLAAIRARLAPREAFVHYGLFEKEAVALVTTREGSRVVALADPGEIRAACEGLRPEDRSVDPASAAARLRDLVLTPLALPPESTRLLVSPDAELWACPFALLLPEREVVFEPSGTVHGLLLADRGKRGKGVLALGDPDYSTGRLSVLRSARPLRRLPATRAEAEAVGTVTLLGREATEPGLAAALTMRPRWRAVHLACHGIADTEFPQRSALAITPDGASDGMLTVLDIFRLRCPADLVVLSACETGRGKVVRGEGLVGLARAFMYAGAPRVIASLWKVDDDATRALMVEFYKRWNAGRPAIAALRDAQAHVRAQPKWAHPHYWAAWVLWGLPE